MMHLSESLQRSLYPTGGQSMLGANILPKFSLEEDITTQYTEQLSPTVPINAYNNKPANGHMMKSNAVIHDSVLMTPTQTRTQPSTALSAGVGGVWTPQGYMKPSMNTPSTAAISVNAATPEPYEALPRNNITGNNNSHFISSAPRQIPGPRQVQSNPSAFVLPSRNRSDANISQSVGDINTVSSLLRSILKQENIDYENDFYWMQQFQKERERDPGAFEQSLAQSMLYSQTSLNPHSFMQRNNYPNRRVYESRGGMTSGHSHVDLDLSITDLGDHPVPSFTDTSQFSQVQPSHVLGTRALSQDSVTHSDIPRELHTTNDHVEIDSTSQNVSL